MRRIVLRGLTACAALEVAGFASAGKLPEPIKTPTGNFITLYAYVAPTANHRVASVDVSICTSSHTPKITEAYPPFFTLALSSGVSVHISASAAKSPALRITPLGPKQCVRGWVSFAVPSGAHVASLVYTFGKPIRWRLG
ncbi:MAG TPA: hypothetical protein VGM80_16905 [Gaiellaceae bacterium]|jgi:hypothetical protein